MIKLRVCGTVESRGTPPADIRPDNFRIDENAGPMREYCHRAVA